MKLVIQVGGDIYGYIDMYVVGRFIRKQVSKALIIFVHRKEAGRCVESTEVGAC